MCGGTITTTKEDLIMRYYFIIFAAAMMPAAFSQTTPDSTAVADSLLAIQLQAELQPPPVPSPQARSAPTTNPDISAIGDFRAGYTTEGSRNIETAFHQLEMQVTSVVDPYGRANFIISLGEETPGGGYSAGLEEATLTSLDLPYSLQVTLGKFKPHFTKVNLLHPHAFSFVDFPVMVAQYFGDEGFTMQGIAASVLLPNPWDFYQELDLDIGRADPNASLDHGTGNVLTIAGHLKNFFDLSDNSTVELGLSGLTGPNPAGLRTTMAGADLTYKWKPVQFNTYNSFTWQNEGLFSRSETPAVAVRSYGAYSFMEYQIEKRIFVGVRADYSGVPDVERSDRRSASLLFRLQPTEFSIFALEFQRLNSHDAPSYDQVVLRAIFGIGTHAAHAY
jgi:hypothetical protein